MRTYEIAGLQSAPIELPVPLIVNLIPTTQTTQRSGVPLELPARIVLTAAPNYRSSDDAEMHRNFLFNGARNERGEVRAYSFHFAVDADSIYQMLPLDEAAISLDDSESPGTTNQVSIQVCSGRGSIVDALMNVEALVRAIRSAIEATQPQSHATINPLLNPSPRPIRGKLSPFERQTLWFRERLDAELSMTHSLLHSQ